MYINLLNVKLNNNVVTTVYNNIEEKENTHFQKGYVYEKISLQNKISFFFYII